MSVVNHYLDLIASNLPALGFFDCCLCTFYVIVEDKGHPLQSVEHDLSQTRNQKKNTVNRVPMDAEKTAKEWDRKVTLTTCP